MSCTSFARRLVLLCAGWLLVACNGSGGGDSPDPGPAPELAQPAAGCAAPLGVGYRVHTFSNGVNAALWYPTTAPEAVYHYASDTASTLASGAEPAQCERFPLIVFSHGLGGCGTQSLFLTEWLARQGYVVVAPDHDDALCSVMSVPPSGNTVAEPPITDPASWNETSYVTRRDDVRGVLDALLTNSPWTASIDPARIGIVGHSLGGYTALGMVGGWPSWKDARIGTAVGLSPYLYPFLQQGRLGAVTVPLQYQGAVFDVFITPSLKGPNGAYALAQPPKVLAELKGGSHFEWTNLLCLGTGTIANCLQTKPNAALINAYVGAFLDLHLKGRNNGLLSGAGAGLQTYQVQLQ